MPHRFQRRILFLEALETRFAPAGIPTAAGPGTVPEGAPYTLQLDAADNTLVGWTVDWGDGVVESLAGDATSASHTYADGSASWTIVATAIPLANLPLVQWSAAGGGNDHYYALTSSLANWTTAEATAVGFGAHLASIGSAGEQSFLAGAFLGAGSERTIYWIGLNDAAQESTFVWSNGDPFTYTNWAGGEPNNFGNEDFTVFNWWFAGSGGLWNDTPLAGANGLPLSGIMEFDALPTGTPTTVNVGVQVNNVAPTVGLSGPASVTAGQLAQFTLHAGDPSAADQAAGFTFAIDWDGNGTTDQTVMGGDGTIVEHTFDAAGAVAVRVTATDRDGGTSAVGEFGVAVLPSAPAATLSGPGTGVRGQTLAFTLTASAGGADPGAVYTFAIDWDGNGSVDHTVAGTSGLTVEHVFAAAGSFTVAATATDAAGNVSDSVSLAVTVSVAALQPNASDPVKTDLVVGGTAGNDVILFLPGSRGKVTVWVNGVSYGSFAPTGTLRAYGYAGNDVLHVVGLKTSAQLFGGTGNDVLFGGLGNDVLVGDSGNDVLFDTAGRNVLIGGLGSDLIFGGRHSLVIAGTTAIDENVAALASILAEWSSDHSLTVKKKNLTDGSGSADRRNGDVFLTSATVRDDGVTDVVFTDRDSWLFTGRRDVSLVGWC